MKNRRTIPCIDLERLPPPMSAVSEVNDTDILILQKTRCIVPRTKVEASEQILQLCERIFYISVFIPKTIRKLVHFLLTEQNGD